MKERTRDLWLIPMVVGLLTALPTGFLFMIWGAAYTGEKLHAPFSTSWLITLLTAPLPMWSILIIVGFGAVMTGAYRHEVARVKDERTKTATQQVEREYAEIQLAKLLAKGPKLHIAWNAAQTFWGLGSAAGEPCIQIGGWAHMSISDTHEELIIVSAYVEGTASRMLIPIRLRPGRILYSQLFTYITPVIATPGKPFRTRLIVIDHQNRKHVLEEHTFRFIGSQKQIDDAVEAGREEPPTGTE
jgi:hypothetical protein